MRRSSLAVAAAALASGVAIVVAPAAVAVGVPLAAGIFALRALTSGVTRGEDAQAYARLGGWVSLGLVLHLLVGWIGHANNIAADSALYDNLAQQIVRHWEHGLPFEPLPSGKEGFFYTLAGLYRVFGHYPAAGVVVNCVLATVTIPVMYDTTRRMFGAEAARFVPPLLLLPAFLIWTSTLLRESMILLLIATSLNAAVRLSDRFGARQFVMMTASVTLLFTFRANVALLLMASLLPALALSRRQLVSGLGTGATVTGLVLVLVLGAGIGYSGYERSATATLQDVEATRGELSTTASSGYAQGADVSTTQGAFTYLPVGLTNFMLGPFPWQARSLGEAIALPDVFLWWMLLPSLWRGVVRGVRQVRRRALLLLLPGGVVAAMLSLLIGNFGTAIRERLQVIILVIPFIALGLALRRARTTDTPVDAAAGSPSASVASPTVS